MNLTWPTTTLSAKPRLCDIGHMDDSGRGIESSGTLTRGRLTYLPVVPGRLEFAWRVRRCILDQHPQVVAVELPESLDEVYSEAAGRLPQMSVIVIPDRDDDDQAAFIPVEPADPFIEALRTAAETGAQTLLLEPATHEKPHVPAAYPEPYAVECIGVEKYVEAWRAHPGDTAPGIAAHSAAMAWKLQGADPFANVLSSYR